MLYRFLLFKIQIITLIICGCPYLHYRNKKLIGNTLNRRITKGRLLFHNSLNLLMNSDTFLLYKYIYYIVTLLTKYQYGQ